MKNIITPCLWFDHQAEEAANFYISIFKNSKITAITRYGVAGQEHHRRPPGSVMVVAFELDGQLFTALNGGPVFKFTDGGDPEAQQCGWVKDKFGLSWQVVPNMLPKLIADPHSERSQRAMMAMMGMKKLNIAELERAYAG